MSLLPPLIASCTIDHIAHELNSLGYASDAIAITLVKPDDSRSLMDYCLSDRGVNLKAHKALPRRQVIPLISSNQTETSPRKRRISNDTFSWVGSASPTLPHPNPHLPLTPPSLPDDTLEKSQDNSEILEVLEDVRLVDNGTPVGLLSPLTPDLTPPRTRTHDALLMKPPYFRYPSSTSAADSFRTAREYATSVDSLNRISSPESDSSTVIQTENKWSNHIPAEHDFLSKRARNIGLGLGLNLERESNPIVMPTTSQNHETYLADVLDDPLVIREAAAVRMAQKVKEELQDTVLEDDIKSDLLPERPDSFSATRDGSLLLKHMIVSNRLQTHRRSLQDAISMEQAIPKSDEIAPARPIDSAAFNPFDSPEANDQRDSRVDTMGLNAEKENPSSSIQEPVSNNNQQRPESTPEAELPIKEHSGTNLLDSDSRRLSRISAGSSNIIEAIVISPPKQKRHKLRRSSKNHCLRDASCSQNNSNRSSLNSNNQVHVLRHKPAILGDKVNRVSINSDSGISMGNDAFSSVKDNAIPLSEIPQRQSSLRGRKKLPPAITDKEKRNSRPLTAPERLMSPTGEIRSQMYPIFDTWSRGPRRSSGSRGREVRHAPPVPIPPRSSSLSAPTSQTNSRHDSMTSEARKVQEIQPNPPGHHRSSSPRVRINLPEPDRLMPTHARERSLDPFKPEDSDASSLASPFLRSSLTRTPFSAISTPGIVEYGQGTTVLIHPHHNESVLMVQHSHRPESQDEVSDQQVSQVVTIPPASQRKAAQPAKSSINELTSQEMRRNISATSTARSVDSTSKPAPSSKAFDISRYPSSRRHSDSYITPLSRLATVAKNTPAKKRIKIDDPSNTLSQFWRPNGFWNDLSDSEDESDTPVASQSPKERLVVSNTLGLLQRPVIAGSVGLAKRLGSLRRRKQIQELQQTGKRYSSVPNLESGIPIHTQATTTPNKRQRNLSFSSISHLHDTINQKRLERSEAQKERKRQKLKKSIGRITLQDQAYAF